MNKIVTVGMLTSALLCNSAFARDDVDSYDIKGALNSPAANAKLSSSVKFFFGDQDYGQVNQDFGTFKTNKKTNALNKSDQEACEWVFLSAMITLQERALKEGANAVVDIKSNYKNNLTSSQETFQCGAGTFVAGVALTGKVVSLK
jgi:uncharacterized protein YbjQ (UPF0145 family)